MEQRVLHMNVMVIRKNIFIEDDMSGCIDFNVVKN